MVVVGYSALMLIESSTGLNPFGALGGVTANSWIRDGQVRSAGAFRNPIAAGAFGAMFCMLYASTIFAYGVRVASLAGLSAGLVIVATARSSGPMLGVAIGAMSLAFWPLRGHMRIVRWGLVLSLAILHAAMNAPVWFLIDRVSDVTGGGGYHRALLIYRFLNSVSSWWLLGTTDTAYWFPYTLADGTADITNRFVQDGVDAGLLGLTLSLLLVLHAYNRLGRSLRACPVVPADLRLIWGLGATLTANVAILFTVTYFDQMFAIWYFFLACVGRPLVSTPTASARTVRRTRTQRADLEPSGTAEAH
jgi:hypothetical protein